MNVDRYSRGRLLPQIGDEGQARLRQSRVLLVGCGALGTVIADGLTRAGIGYLRIVDRDIVELTNLHRQVLFDEHDALEGKPKAIAAMARLSRINSHVEIEPSVADFCSANAAELSRDVHLILDGTDNVATRYLVNDLSVKLSLPWIYGACVGVEGRVMTIRPGETPCLRCVFSEPPAVGELPTCDTAGVLNAAAGVVASLQLAAAIRLLTSRHTNHAATNSKLITMNVWEGRFHAVDLSAARRGDCPTCALRQFEFLSKQNDDAVSLCGRSSVQIRPQSRGYFDFQQVARRLSAAIQVEQTPHLLRFELSEIDGGRLTLFPDGRAIILGTTDLLRAKSIYAKYVGE